MDLAVVKSTSLEYTVLLDLIYSLEMVSTLFNSSGFKACLWLKSNLNFSGETKDLVIIEESGIAKGIRRIVAVTGSEAHEVQRIASEFGESLDAATTLFGVEWRFVQ